MAPKPAKPTPIGGGREVSPPRARGHTLRRNHRRWRASRFRLRSRGAPLIQPAKGFRGARITRSLNQKKKGARARTRLCEHREEQQEESERTHRALSRIDFCRSARSGRHVISASADLEPENQAAISKTAASSPVSHWCCVQSIGSTMSDGPDLGPTTSAGAVRSLSDRASRVQIGFGPPIG